MPYDTNAGDVPPASYDATLESTRPASMDFATGLRRRLEVAAGRQARPAVGATTVAVVDSQWADYAAMPQAVRRPPLKWCFLATGNEALRLARSEPVDLWVVNVVLADMSGIDLCAMLRARSPPPPVYLVGDAYRVEDERAARTSGTALYACKPVRAEWFNHRIRPP